MSKKIHTYKKAAVVLYIFHLLLEGKELTIKDLSSDLYINKSTLYLYLYEIDLFIAEFQLYEYYELIKESSVIKLKKNRKVMITTTSILIS